MIVVSSVLYEVFQTTDSALDDEKKNELYLLLLSIMKKQVCTTKGLRCPQHKGYGIRDAL